MSWKEILPVAGLVVLLAVAIVIYTAVTSPPEQPPPQDNSLPYFFITQTDHVALNAGRDAYVSALYTNYSMSKIVEVQAEFVTLREPPMRHVYILDYPRVESPGYDAFMQRLSDRLAFYHISIRNISVDDALFLRKSILISANGAVPAKFTQNQSAKFFLDNGNALILLGAPNRVLNPDRSLDDIGSSFTDSVSGYPRYIQRPSLREGWATPEEAADEVYDIVLYNSWQEPVSTRTVHLRFDANETQGQTALFSSTLPEGSYYASVLLTAFPVNSSYSEIGGILDSAPSSRLNGTIISSFDLSGNETVGFDYELHDRLESPTHLTLYTEVAQGDRRIFRQYLDDITMQDFWHSQSDLNVSLAPGDYELRVVDQSGKRYAASYLHVKSMEVRLLNAQDVYYRFGFYIDDQPVSGAKVIVSLDNSTNSREFTTDGNGEFTVPAGLSTGDHVFNFNTTGRLMRVPYTNTQVSIVTKLTQYYALAGLVILVLLVATRRGISQSWSLVVDAPPPKKAHMARIRPSELFRIMNLYEEERGWKNVPLAVNDVFIAVKKYVTLDGKPVMATESNLLDVLGQLVKKGLVLHYMDYYLPAAWPDGSDYKRLCAVRHLSDAILELGLTPEPEPGCDVSVKSPLGTSLILVYSGQQPSKILALSAKGRGILLFMEEQDLIAFRKKLLSSDPEWAHIALNSWNGKLQLMMLSEFRTNFGTWGR